MSGAQDEFINYVEQQFHLTGSVPDHETAASHLNTSTQQIGIWYANPTVRSNLGRRGIDVLEHRHNLNPAQLTAAMLATSVTDRRMLNRKLKEAGILPSQFDAWLKLPKFQRFLTERASTNLSGSVPLAENALSQAAANGDLRAVQFLMEVTGRYRPNNSDKVNLEVMLVRISEIVSSAINRLVDDQFLRSALLQDISQGVLALMPKESLARTTIVNDTTEFQPAVAALDSGNGRAGVPPGNRRIVTED